MAILRTTFVCSLLMLKLDRYRQILNNMSMVCKIYVSLSHCQQVQLKDDSL